MKPERGYESLRRFRHSETGSTYFVTLCTFNRSVGLTGNTVAKAMQSEIRSISQSGHWLLRSAVIMPDHVHFLFSLTGKLQLGRVIARFKSKTKEALNLASLRWQGNYHDHRLRPDEPIETVLRYLYLNPYRAGLIATVETYPWHWLGDEEAAWFKPLLEDDKTPFPDWLR